jgi:vitamin B12 transporter
MRSFSCYSIFIFLFIFLSIVSPTIAQAEEPALEVTVEAGRVSEIPRSAAVTVITLSDLQRRNRQTVADVLREVPGVDVVESGGSGQVTTVFIRGSESRHTLVLVDGIIANEPMSVGAAFDFGNLDSTNIERIEVYRGPQGVRFGSGAIGGVINIVTKMGSGPSRANFAVEGGSYKTLRGSTNVSGKEGQVNYSLGVDAFRTDGFSAADADLGNSEIDGDQRISLSSRLGFEVTDAGKLDWTMRYTQNKSDIDMGGGTGADDPNFTSNYKQFLTGLSLTNYYLTGHLRSNLLASYSSVDRFSRNLPDPVHTTGTSDGYVSDSLGIETTQDWFVSEDQTLRFYFQNLSQSGFANSISGTTATLTEKHEEILNGEAVSYLYDGHSVFGEIGARANQQSAGDAVPSYRAVIGTHLATSTTLQVIYGTGYKAPSLDELYGNFGANPNLKAEYAQSYEASVEQNISDNAMIALAYFNTKYRDLISYTTGYVNIASATSQGLELSGRFDATSFLQLHFNGKYLDARDDTTGLKVLRRPSLGAAADLRYHLDRFEASLYYRYFGMRSDVDSVTFATIDMPSYSVFALTSAYSLNSSYQLTARIENLFNQKYEEISGYGTAGLSGYIGARSLF